MNKNQTWYCYFAVGYARVTVVSDLYLKMIYAFKNEQYCS